MSRSFLLFVPQKSQADSDAFSYFITFDSILFLGAVAFFGWYSALAPPFA